MNLSILLVTPLVGPFEICVRAGDLLLFAGDSELTSAPIDLSKATRLRDIAFLCGRLGAEWAAMVLRAVTSNHQNLRQITLSLPDLARSPFLHRIDPANVRDALGEAVYSHWLDLDHVLAQLWESHSTRPRILHYTPSGEDWRGPNSCVDGVFPEITRRGIADLVVRA